MALDPPESDQHLFADDDPAEEEPLIVDDDPAEDEEEEVSELQCGQDLNTERDSTPEDAARTTVRPPRKKLFSPRKSPYKTQNPQSPSERKRNRCGCSCVDVIPKTTRAPGRPKGSRNKKVKSKITRVPGRPKGSRNKKVKSARIIEDSPEQVQVECQVEVECQQERVEEVYRTREVERRIQMSRCALLDGMADRMLAVERQVRNLGFWIREREDFMLPHLVEDIQLICRVGSNGLIANVNNIRLHQMSTLRLFD